MTGPMSHKSDGQAARFKVLYVGPDARGIEKALSFARQPVGLNTVTGIARALAAAKSNDIDCAVIDQRADSNEGSLLVASLAGMPTVKRIIVVTEPEDSFGYQTLGPKLEIVCDPLDRSGLAAAIFAETSPEFGKPANTAKSIGRLMSVGANAVNALRDFAAKASFARLVIPFVSLVYKNIALVVLGALFAVFVSYGILIAFFLISSDWAAPLTLSKGHELVVSAERRLNELKVKRNIVGQQLAKERDETQKARQSFDDAKVMYSLVANVVDGEIEQRLVLQKDLTRQVRHLGSLRRQMQKALGNKAGFEPELRRKYQKRLINRKTYDSGLLGILELRQRAAGLEAEVARYRRDAHAAAQAIRMLESVRQQMQLPEIRSIAGASAEFAPLANQIVEVKTALKNAKRGLNAHSERLKLLKDNGTILDKSIAQLAATPLVRAASSPVVVLFVPYQNTTSFKTGETLYSCAVSIFWCRKVGVVAAKVPGEVTALHPFFGKNMRGVFIEAILDDKGAAQQEVLHVGRPPLFF